MVITGIHASCVVIKDAIQWILDTILFSTCIGWCDDELEKHAPSTGKWAPRFDQYHQHIIHAEWDYVVYFTGVVLHLVRRSLILYDPSNDTLVSVRQAGWECVSSLWRIRKAFPFNLELGPRVIIILTVRGKLLKLSIKLETSWKSTMINEFNWS